MRSLNPIVWRAEQPIAPLHPGQTAGPRSPWAWAVPLAALAGLLLVPSLGLNRSLFLAINQISDVTGHPLWANLTILGDTLVMMSLVFPFVGRRPDVVFAAFLGGILATLWVHGLKQPLGIDRPPASIAQDLFTVIGPAHYHHAFPSGHTTTGVFLAGLIALHWPGRAVAWLALAAGLATGIARIAVGVHWPMDVLGGIFGGWLAAVGGVWMARRWHWGYTLIGQRIFGGVLAACTVWLFFHNTGYPDATALQYTIAGVALISGGWGLARLRPRAP